MSKTTMGPPADALAPRPGASPGLLRRRYSVPETIMRKYRLAQLRSDTDESETPSPTARPSSPARGAPRPRRDRELMRRSALMRRLWSRAPCPAGCRACDQYGSDRELAGSRSLDGSHTELRQCMSGSQSSRSQLANSPERGCECCRRLALQYPIRKEPFPRSPKRQRLDTPCSVSRSDEMLRAAMRNSYDKMEESQRQREMKANAHFDFATSESCNSSALLSTSKTDSSNCMSCQAATMSYPITTSDAPSFTKSTNSTSSTEPTSYRPAQRPSSVDSATDHHTASTVKQTVKKRRQSVNANIFTNSQELLRSGVTSEALTNSVVVDTESTTNASGSNYGTGDNIELTSGTNTLATSVSSTDNVTSSAYAKDESVDSSLSPNSRYETTAGHTNAVQLQKTCVSSGGERQKQQLFKDNASTSSLEVLEIVVSETLNSTAFPDYKRDMPKKTVPNSLITKDKIKLRPRQDIDIDEYVSNLLIESLNSLTDQIDEMNTSINGDNKLSIVEKEIKLKLQNCHSISSSPTTNKSVAVDIAKETTDVNSNENETDSADQHYRDDKETPDKPQLNCLIQNSFYGINNNNLAISFDSSNDNLNYSSLKQTVPGCISSGNENTDATLMNEKINKAVLQQIQKLFQDGIDVIDTNLNFTNQPFPRRVGLPDISHIEISNVDVFIDEDSAVQVTPPVETALTTHDAFPSKSENTCHSLPESNANNMERVENVDNALGNVGTGAYYKVPAEPVLVPRFSALPNTDSMEVNTSSDEGDGIPSDCTSLVDSLDDPNSPRSIYSKYATYKKTSELARSNIDVLELLPDLSKGDESTESPMKEKSESFFIRIKGNECDCEKENIIVAEHMPDKIKQRLFRRHRKREMKMEHTKRKKIRQLKREIEKQRKIDAAQSKKEIEIDCVNILASLIDQVAEKLADDDVDANAKSKMRTSNLRSSNDQQSKLSKKQHNAAFTPCAGKSHEPQSYESFKITRPGYMQLQNSLHSEDKFVNYRNKTDSNTKSKGEYQVMHGKLSFQPHTPTTPEESGPKRFYQKSEFHDGSKRVEILEILEYIDSSPENNSDESNNGARSIRKGRKSKIPVPIYERIHRGSKSKNFQKPYKNLTSSDKLSSYKVDQLIANILIDALQENGGSNGGISLINPMRDSALAATNLPQRRASVPQQETVSRNNKVNNAQKYKQTFDIIPEEKSSLSVGSSNEEIREKHRRASLPEDGQPLSTSDRGDLTRSNVIVASLESTDNNNLQTAVTNSITLHDLPVTKVDIATSTSSQTPPMDIGHNLPLQRLMKSATTSPLRKTTSAATSPIPQDSDQTTCTNKSPKQTNLLQSKEGDKMKSVNGKKAQSPDRGTREGWVGLNKSRHTTDTKGPYSKVAQEASCPERAVVRRGSPTTPPSQVYLRALESGKIAKLAKSGQQNKEGRPIKSKPDDNRTLKANKLSAKDLNANRNESSSSSSNKSGDRRDSSSTKKSFIDTQTTVTDVLIKKTDGKKVKMLALKKSESQESFNEKAVKLPDPFLDKRNNNPQKEPSSNSDSDSGKSLLCSLAPKWLNMGNGSRQKRLTKKRESLSDQTQPNANTEGWSVTVAGNCYTALPADVEMRLSFPRAPRPAACQSDSGLGEEVARACRCRHCDECTCNLPGATFLPPAQHSRKVALMVKNEMSGSAVHATKTTKKKYEPLPEVETYQATRNKSKNSVKMPRRFSLHCWLPEDGIPPPRRSNGLAVMGCAIIPELKPRVPTMSERDLTRVYAARQYSRP